MFAVWYFVEFAVIRPRSTKIVVQGREVFVPRSSYRLLRAAVMFGCFMALITVGTLMENDLLFFFVGLPFGAMVLWGMLRVPKDHAVPSPADMERGRELGRSAMVLVALGVGESVVLGIAAGLGGLPGIIVALVGTALTVVAAWHTWRVVKLSRRRSP
jgi:hypothetical protein